MFIYILKEPSLFQVYKQEEGLFWGGASGSCLRIVHIYMSMCTYIYVCMCVYTNPLFEGPLGRRAAGSLYC